MKTDLPFKHSIRDQKGSMFIMLGPLMTVMLMGIVAIMGTAAVQLRVLRSTQARESAFQIAEAGINYYQWHLAHFSTDYADGTGQSCSTTCGPFVKDYIDSDTNQVVGQYSLVITPPLIGSTLVTIQSTGWTTANPSVRRVITARYGIPSLAKYGFLTHNYVHIGSTSTFYGEFHSNSGIRFNGTGNAPITSAKQTYTCDSGNTIDDCTGTHNGIWADAGGPTGGQSTRDLWRYPEPNVDYSTITSDLAGMKTSAQSGGLYLAPSSQQGYLLRFQSNGTIRIYKVTSLQNDPTGYDASGVSHPENVDYQNLNEQTTICNPYPCNMPSNGVIYIEDKTWVEGTVKGRAIVAAAQLPYNAGTAPSILIQNNLVYAAKDGTNVLGLLGQKDVLLTHGTPNNLEVNAALIAQNGSFQRYDYSDGAKSTLTVYGSISSFGRAAIYYGDSGYATRNYTYDADLLYGPPPNFPLSTDGYQQVSWSSN